MRRDFLKSNRKPKNINYENNGIYCWLFVKEMKNILNEKPNDKLDARLQFSTKFVKDYDIKNKKILDIGCGFGWFEVNVLKRGAGQIVGIEISYEDLKSARTIKDKRAVFKVGGVLKIPFKDNYFDTVVAWEVIEHIPKNTEDKMFKEVYRVLKNKGSFYLSTPYDSIISKYLDPAWWLIGHRHYSKEKLLRFGNKNNFKIAEIYTKGRCWNLVNILNMYISKWIFRRKQFFERKLSKKEEKEFKKEGFMGIFVKYEM